MSTTETDETSYTPSAPRVNKEELEKAKRRVSRCPNIGFDKMFAHNPPMRVIIVEEPEPEEA